MLKENVYTEDGIDMGTNYKYAANEYGEYDNVNKCWIIRKFTKPDDTIIKKYYIALKPNNLGSAMYTDYTTGLQYADCRHIRGGLFVGTAKELDDYCNELIKQGINIQDIYDYEEED